MKKNTSANLGILALSIDNLFHVKVANTYKVWDGLVIKS